MLFNEKTNVMHVIDPVTKEKIVAKQEKNYLILITWDDDGNVSTEWRRMTGKRDVIDFFLSNLDIVDLNESFVISESAVIRQAWSPFTFIRFCQEQGVFDEQMESDLNYTFEDFVRFIKDNYEIDDEGLDDMYVKETNMK